jgi:transcriptional regulator with XRE-family HTH domain
MAKIFGVTKQSVSNWENENIMPSVDMLVKIADFFNVSTDFLLGLTDKHALNTDGLSELQIAHIQAIINDILQVECCEVG